MKNGAENRTRRVGPLRDLTLSLEKKKLRVVTLHGRFVAFKFRVTNEIDKVALRPICHAIHSREVLYFSLVFLFSPLFRGDVSRTEPFVFRARAFAPFAFAGYRRRRGPEARREAGFSAGGGTGER